MKLNQFITIYIEKRAMPITAGGALLLPSTFAIRKMLQKYNENCQHNEKVSVFIMIEYFHLIYPQIRKITERTDYCSTCHIKKKSKKFHRCF